MTRAEGERRIVSVLLADIADSTTIGERLGPERSKFLFDEVTRLLVGEVKRFGGSVAQFTGDGLYALFGVPTAHDDDAERAVRAALAMQGALGAYAKDVREAYGVELAGRVGVNTGPIVLLADDGAPPEERFNALGDTVNTAARLQAAAGRGGVAVAPATAQQIEGSFDLESIGELELKGKAAPIEVFRIAGEREREAREISPLVGRDREVGVLVEVMADLAAGRGAIVAITGEPGIGKSRLIAEVRRRAERDARFFAAQGISYAQDVPYYPLRELLRACLGLGIADPEARVRLELKLQLASSLDGKADAYYPFLASLLGLTLEDDAAQRLDGLATDSVQRQSHEAVIELVRALAHEQPVCLVLEDLHFADEPTLELFEEALQLADDEPVALLLAYRHDPDLRSWELGEAARRRYRHRFRELQLEPLDAAAAAQLATAAAGRDLPDDVAAQLAERTGGNPLFLEEAARDAVERGDGATVPAAIQETLQARLARLAPDVREVASIASVVGRSFGQPLLERLVAPEQLRPALSELQRLDLVVEERRRPTPEYRFRHGLVREAAYTSLLEQRRRDLHRVVGTALEELSANELAEAYGLLAHHFAEADEPDRAARYLLEAGDAAKAVYADEEASGHYRRALPFLDRLGDSQRARAVLFKIALAHHLAFEFEAANAAWADAFARPEPPVRRIERTQRLETAMVRPRNWVPGHGYDVVAWSFGPNFFRGLLRLAAGLHIVPDLAEHVSVSPDGRAYAFRLRDGLRWSDGERLTADDFAFTYDAMREQNVGSAHLLEGIEARAVDPLTLELRLPEPRAHVLYLFAQLPFFPWPRHKVEELGPEWHLEPTRVGNGPFVDAEEVDGRWVFPQNPYWPSSSSNVAELAIVPLDPLSSRPAWDEGRFDFLLMADYFVGDVADGSFVAAATLSTSYVAFNEQAPFDDIRVRKALAHGLDRAPVTRGPSPAAYGGFLPPAMPGHSHDLAPVHDVDLARTLLAEAGYPEGRGLPELRLVHADPGFSAEMLRGFEEQWAGQWRDLGVRFRQEAVTFEDYRTEVQKPGAIANWGWASDYPDPDGLLSTFLAAQAAVAPDEVTALVARARASHDRDARLELFREADRILVAEQTWVVPVLYDGFAVLHRRNLEGLWSNPMGMAPLDGVFVDRSA
ncbi:MAG: ABC transporter substrate-binding protein [Gaiellaceae bacterium]|jgi:ABC-type transport system substrate-binding protein/class 3 adenylate cyclase